MLFLNCLVICTLLFIFSNSSCSNLAENSMNFLFLLSKWQLRWPVIMAFNIRLANFPLQSVESRLMVLQSFICVDGKVGFFPLCWLHQMTFAEPGPIQIWFSSPFPPPPRQLTVLTFLCPNFLLIYISYHSPCSPFQGWLLVLCNNVWPHRVSSWS